MHQKFRSRMIGHYNRSCHIIMHNMCEMWGLIYLRTMRTVPMSCHVLPPSPHMQASQPPLCKCGMPEITYGHAACTSKQYLSKLTASHFSTLNMKIANQNVLKRILIVMHNKNKADCIQNFRICAGEPLGPLYKQ